MNIMIILFFLRCFFFTFSIYFTSLPCLFVSPPVFNLQLRAGSDLLLGVPEDKLRAEDGYHVDGRGGLQRHHPANSRFSARRIQQISVQDRKPGQVGTE